MVLRHRRDVEAIAEELKVNRRIAREASRPTGTEINLTTDTAIAAAAAAEEAQTSADGKNTVVRSPSAATAAGSYKQGDQWWQFSGANIVGLWLHSGSAWVSQALTNAIIATLDAGKITTGVLAADRIGANSITTAKLAATAIDGMTVTGATLRTAASGQRLQLDINGLGAYDASGALVSRLYSAAGRFEVQSAPITGRTVPRLYLSTTVTSGGVAQSRGDAGKPSAQAFAPYFDLTAQQNPGGSSKLVLGSGSAERGDDHDALVTLRAVGGAPGTRRIDLVTGNADTPLNIGESGATTQVDGRFVVAGELVFGAFGGFEGDTDWENLRPILNYSGTWVNSGPGWRIRRRDGMILLRGVVTNSNSYTSFSAFSGKLPTHYRPDATIGFTANSNASTVRKAIQIEADGTFSVYASAAGSAAWYLDGIQYAAA